MIAEVIIVPEENFRDHPTLVFPSNTMAIYDLLNKRFQTEAAINDEDYQEISLNSKKHRFGKYFVNMLIAPVFASVIASMIYEKIKNEDPKDEVELEILIQGKSGKSKSIKYQGTAERLNKVTEAITKLTKENDEYRTDSTKTTTSEQPK